MKMRKLLTTSLCAVMLAAPAGALADDHDADTMKANASVSVEQVEGLIANPITASAYADRGSQEIVINDISEMFGSEQLANLEEFAIENAEHTTFARSLVTGDEVIREALDETAHAVDDVVALDLQQDGGLEVYVL